MFWQDKTDWYSTKSTAVQKGNEVSKVGGKGRRIAADSRKTDWYSTKSTAVQKGNEVSKVGGKGRRIAADSRKKKDTKAFYNGLREV